MDLTPIIKSVQRRLGVTDDGEAGEETWFAIYKGAFGVAWQPAPVVPLPPLTTRPILNPPNGEDLRARMVVELSQLVGGRETAGSNQSPAIDALWQYTSYPNGWQDRAPYCAATICAVAHRAAGRIFTGLECPPLPTSPSCQGMLDWARDPANKCLVFAPGDPAHTPMAGDIVSYLPRLSHTGLLAQDYAGGSGLIHTLEGNTNGAGERDGDGFWARTRPLSLVGHFIRLAAA